VVGEVSGPRMETVLKKSPGVAATVSIGRSPTTPTRPTGEKRGRRVVALSSDTAAIECGNGNIVTFRKKP
jgi:hypothetical protein